jgi:AraC-like DNA-binding protein
VDGVELFGASFRRFTYARHSHDCLAFGSVERGAMRFWHGGAEYLASKGDMITLNPGEVHDGRTDPGGCRYHMLYVQQSAIEEIFATAEPRLRSGAALKGPLLRDATLARVVGRFATQTSDSLEQQTGLAGILFQLFARHGMPPLAVRPVAHERKCVERAKDYMVQCLDRPILLRDIAQAAGLSSFYFLRTFKAAAGMPPHAYLNQIRLARARQLLRAGEPPAAVAAATGFVDQSHLNRRFKSTFGVTPSQYRKTS